MNRGVLYLSVALLYTLVGCSDELPQPPQGPLNSPGKMTHFEHSLRAMEHLLTAVGEHQWTQWIREDIERWRLIKSSLFSDVSKYDRIRGKVLG